PRNSLARCDRSLWDAATRTQAPIIRRRVGPWDLGAWVPRFRVAQVPGYPGTGEPECRRTPRPRELQRQARKPLHCYGFPLTPCPHDALPALSFDNPVWSSTENLDIPPIAAGRLKPIPARLRPIAATSRRGFPRLTPTIRPPTRMRKLSPLGPGMTPIP